MKTALPEFFEELQRRLDENRRLYRDDSPFSVLDVPWARFLAPLLGVNPWKVMVPAAFLIALFLRLVFGQAFSEAVLRVLGGR